jgi:hypothetical protein
MRGTLADAEDISAGDESGRLKDLTPPKFACAMWASCPAVLKDESSGRYVIIGKWRDPNSPAITGRVGPDEVALEISADLIESAIREAIAERDNIYTQINSLSREAGQLFLNWLNGLPPAASAPGPNAQTAPRTETAAAPSS